MSLGQPRTRRTALPAIDGRSLVTHLAGVGAIAVCMRFVGYAAAVSYGAWLGRKDIDASKVAEQTFHISGALCLIGALLLLTIRG